PPLLITLSFFIYSPLATRHLPSFPTRRSSDLASGETLAYPPRWSPSSYSELGSKWQYVDDGKFLTPTYACRILLLAGHALPRIADRKSTRLNSSHVSISYAVFCLKKKNNKKEY